VRTYFGDSAGDIVFVRTHADVIVVTEIKKFLPDELSAVVSNDRIRDPKMENGAPDEIYGLLGADFG
jgi:hypothetical protein